MTGHIIQGTLSLRHPPAPTVPAPEAMVDQGRTPKIAKAMALAIKLDTLVRQGHIKDYAQVARLGYVTRARVTQIMNLLMLAPDIQEQILFLPPMKHGRDTIHERSVRRIAAIPDWKTQRRRWAEKTLSPQHIDK